MAPTASARPAREPAPPPRGPLDPPRAGRWGGFTLIELLVVVAVIVILAALVLPTVTASFRSAVGAHCISNLRQISEAFICYVKQHKGFMPPKGSPSSSPPHRFPKWYHNLETFIYTDAKSIFACPAKDTAKYGYGLNHGWCGYDQIWPRSAMNDRTREIDKVRNPSGTIIICDTGLLANDDTDIPVDQWTEQPGNNVNGCVRFPFDNKLGEPGDYKCWHTDPRRPMPRHGTGQTRTTFLFFDTHVEPIETADVVDDMWGESGCLYDNEGVRVVD